VRLQEIGEMVHVHDGLLDARGGEAVEHVIDQRLAVHLDHRLGLAVGQRPHARAEAGGEDHGTARGRMGGHATF